MKNKTQETPFQDQYQSLTPVYGQGFATNSLLLSKAILLDEPIPASSVYQIIKNELLMDAKPGLNLATFCNEAYTDPWGAKVVENSIMKNFIDHTEYPGTNLVEKRSIRIMATELGTKFDREIPPAHKHEEASQSLYGTATIGSSEAIMLGLIAYKFIWNLKQRVLLNNQEKLHIRADARDRPVVLMSSQVHGSWGKFCRYYDAVPLYIPVDQYPYAIHSGSIITDILNTKIEDPYSEFSKVIRTQMGYEKGTQGDRLIGELVMAVGACVGTTYTGNYDNVPSIDDAVDDFCMIQNNQYSQQQKDDFETLYIEEYNMLYPKVDGGPSRIPELMDISIHVDAASGFVLMFSSTGSAVKFNFEQCPKRVSSINLSNHKFGMTFTGMGSVIFKNSKVVDQSLVYHIAYLGGSFGDYTVNFSRGSAMVVMQYYNFLRFGRYGYRDILDNCVNNSRWFVNEIIIHPILRKYFANISNYPIGLENNIVDKIYFPIIALTWADPSDTPTWDLVDMSDKLAQSGWVVPAYNIPRYTPEDIDGIQVLRIVVQQVVTREKLNTLLYCMIVAIKELNDSKVVKSYKSLNSRRSNAMC